jgi:hypothetical protein
MKKILRFLAPFGVSLMMLTGVAAAESTISNTGPDSTNVIVNKSTSSVRITCRNNLDISNTNTQNASSGSANVSNNTTGGSATSGNASNTNTTSVTVNTGCGTGQVATTTPPPTGGGGGGLGGGAGGSVLGASTVAAAAAGGMGAGAITSLPNTGANPALLAGIVTAVLGGVATVARIGVLAYGATKYQV